MATSIDFPSQLPTGQQQGYGLQHTQPFVRTQMVSGRARQRRTFTKVPTQVDVSWVFSPEETLLFEAWFRDDINDGADWFNADLRSPTDGYNNPGVSSYECRFTKMYDGPDMDGPHYWKVKARLEIIERPLLVPGWTLFPELILGASIFDIAINREYPEP